MAWTAWRTPARIRLLLLAVCLALGVPFLFLLAHRSASPRILFYSAEYAVVLVGYALVLGIMGLGACYPSSVGRHVLRGLAVMALLFLALEAGSRLEILGPFSAGTAFRRNQAFDHALGYRLLPDRSLPADIPGESLVPTRTFRFDSEEIGFRSHAPSGRAEIVAVGDGMTFAGGLAPEETWVALVGRALQAHTFNFGMPATGPGQYLHVLERYGLRLKPRLVLLAFYTGSDFFDDWLFQKWRASGTPLDIVEYALFGQSRPTAFLANHSAAFANGAILFNRLVKVGEAVTVATRDGALLLRPTRLDMTGEGVREGWRLARESMRTARRLATSAGADFVVVVVPTKEEVYLPVVPGTERFQREDLDWRAAHQSLVTFLQGEGFLFCDPLPRLQLLAANGQRLHFQRGVYLNRGGHREVAAILTACLRDLSAG
jgi:hypothetical protein